MSDSGEFSHVLARTNRTRSVLASYLAAPSASNPLARALAYILQSQRDDGAWGADYPAWTDLTTACALEALFAAGLSDNGVWQVTSASGRGPYLGSVANAVSYLLSQQGPGWGSDVFDTCKVLKVLMSLRNHDVPHQRIAEALDYVALRLTTVEDGAESGEWDGAGTYAAALGVFQLADDKRNIAKTMARLIERQDPTSGCFAKDCSSGLQVWHTSNALLALHNAGLPPGNPVVEAGGRWLLDVQNKEDGSWTDQMLRMKVIFSSYAISALASLRGEDDAAVRLGIEWLERRQRLDDGSIEGAEGTVVAMAAFACRYPTTSPFPLIEVIEIDALLASQEQLCGRLTAERSLRSKDQETLHAVQDSMVRLEQELTTTRERLEAVQAGRLKAEQALEAEPDRYILRVTNRVGAVIGLAVGIAGLVLTVAFELWR